MLLDDFLLSMFVIRIYLPNQYMMWSDTYCQIMTIQREANIKATQVFAFLKI